MKKLLAFAIPVAAIVMAFNACTGGSQETYPEAKAIAQQYCGSCHLFPEASLLDRKTWSEHVLPAMREYMGIPGNFAALFDSLSPEQVLALQEQRLLPQNIIPKADWDMIRLYYATEAPEQLPATAWEAPADTLAGFKVRWPKPATGEPATIMLRYVNQKLFTGDANSRQLTQWNITSLKAADSVTLSSPPVWMAAYMEQLEVLEIGALQPYDNLRGRLTSFTAQLDGQRNIKSNLARPVHFQRADLNGDGTPDLLVCEYGNRGGALVWYNVADRMRRHVLMEAPGAIVAYVQDLDKDGRSDVIALMAQAQEGIYAFYNQGNGKFLPQTLLAFHPLFGSSFFELADFNGDGHPDIVLANGDNADYSVILKPYHGIRIFINDGRWQFKEQYFYPLDGATRVIARDFDQDGDLDLAVVASFANYSNHPRQAFVYLKNESKGANLNFVPLTFKGVERARWFILEAGDFDEDGDTDIAIGAMVYAPAVIPDSLRGRWQKEAIPFVILENELKTRQAQ